jgi:hypothetical protein
MAALREYFGRSTFKIDLARQQIAGQRLDFEPAKEQIEPAKEQIRCRRPEIGLRQPD